MKLIRYKFKEVECPVVRDPDGSSDPRREPVEGLYFVYLLECNDNSLYCGSSDNLKRRLSDHNKGDAAVWTRIRRPVQLVYIESHVSLLSARRREKQIKGWVQSKKTKLITHEWTKI